MFNKRFEIVFQNEDNVLGTDEEVFSTNNIYYQITTKTLFVKKLNKSVDKISVLNMRGQTVFELQDVSAEQLENGMKLNNIATGAYVVCLRTDTNELLTKKIIVK